MMIGMQFRRPNSLSYFILFPPKETLFIVWGKKNQNFGRLSKW